MTECTDYEEYEDEELREMARSSDAWYRGTTEAIAIINELAQNKTVVDRAITRIAKATNHDGHVYSMLMALRILNEKADDPDAFAQYLRDIRAPKT